MLLVLLLGIADFGRVFSAGITLEAAARNSAEAAAQEYLQLARNKTGGLLSGADYQHIHDLASSVACDEGQALPSNGGGCKLNVSMCVHDNLDTTLCGSEASAAPGNCTQMHDSWDAANLGATPGGATPLPYIEVRVCYRFTTLINLANLQLPFGWSLSLGELWLERGREFVVASY